MYARPHSIGPHYKKENGTRVPRGLGQFSCHAGTARPGSRSSPLMHQKRFQIRAVLGLAIARESVTRKFRIASVFLENTDFCAMNVPFLVPRPGLSAWVASEDDLTAVLAAGSAGRRTHHGVKRASLPGESNALVVDGSLNIGTRISCVAAIEAFATSLTNIFGR